MPRFEVPQQTPRSQADDENLIGLTLDMKVLAELPKQELIGTLRHIETAYAIWIDAEKAKLTAPSEKLGDHQDAAKRAVKGCERAQLRIKAVIDLIESNPLAEEAFRFANRAMWQQRIHSIFSRACFKNRFGLKSGTYS